MKVDENIFFREATLRICSTLELNKALKKSLLYLRKFMPAGSIALYFYHYDTGILEAIAGSGLNNNILERGKMQLPPRIRKKIETEWMDHRVRLIDRMAENEITADLARNGGTADLSGIVMDMMLEGEEVGVLVLISDGNNKFELEHVNLLKQLNEPFSIALTNGRRYQELLDLKNVLNEDNIFLKKELFRMTGEEVIGANNGLKKVMELVRQVAPLESPVLLLGETGAGKEVIAGAIHNLSPRKNGPLIKVNCGAIPETIMDSELFGHERGSFTGAIGRKKGWFERANGGTIFLDEIGELHHAVQVRLLRVLQEKEIERVGGHETIKLDIRVIAATHQDLELLLKQGKLREDLYFRLKIFPISIPPLRQRKEDIPHLVHHFIQKKCRDMKFKKLPTLATGALERLKSYEWPGNARELENVVERELIINREGPLAFVEIENTKTEDRIYSEDRMENHSLDLNRIMRETIEKALSLSGGKVEGKQGAAELLSLNPWTLRHRMKKLGIPLGQKDKVTRNAIPGNE